MLLLGSRASYLYRSNAVLRFDLRLVLPFIMNTDRFLELDLDVYGDQESDQAQYVVVRGYQPGCTSK